MGHVVVAGVARTEAVGLGHAVADVGPAPGEALLDPVHELGRRRRPAAADAGQRRRVVGGERRALQHVPALGRHADEGGDPLGLDEAQGGLGVPAVHHHELELHPEARQHHRDAAGDVEERDDQDEARGEAATATEQVLALAGGEHGRVAPEPHEAVDHGAVGRDGALGEARRARRVEDGGVVVRVDRDLRHRVAQGDHLVEALHPGRVRLELVAPHHDHRDAAGVGRGMGPLDPLRVGDEQGEAGVLDRVVELGLGPPGVERHRHGADRQDGRERDDPLGEVAHGDADPVALRDPVGVHEGVGQGVHVAHGLGEGPPLVLVDQELGLVATGPGEQLAQVGRGVLEHPQRPAPDVRLHHLEELSGARDLRQGLLVREWHGATSFTERASGPVPK